VICPEPGQRVTLTLPPLETLLAWVEAPGERYVTLVPERPVERFYLDQPGEASLAFSSPRGIHRLRGAVEPAFEGDTLMFEPRDHGVIQRREQVRVDVVTRVAFRAPAAEPIELFTLDVSGGGALVADRDERLPAGRYEVSLPLHDGEPSLETLASVESRPGLRAVRFEGLDRDDQERLVRFVFEHQRLRRQRGLRAGAGARPRWVSWPLGAGRPWRS
jgi:catechol 2,3-dioxygenase-like lactoylglutathione lyase family enzyme